MGSEPELRIRTKATSEGPVFFPFGSWGGGYVLDARGGQRLAVWSRWQIWVQCIVVMLFIPDYVPGNLGLRFAAYLLVVTALQHAAYWFCVRDGRRTAVRLTAEESLRMQAEAARHGQIGLMAFLLTLAVGFVVWRGFFAPYPHWGPVTTAVDLALCAWAAAYLARLAAMKRRQTGQPPSQPAFWMRKR